MRKYGKLKIDIVCNYNLQIRLVMTIQWFILNCIMVTLECMEANSPYILTYIAHRYFHGSTYTLFSYAV